MKLSLLIVAALLLASTQAGDRKCRALAMSGGGDKGAYEAAVYLGLVNNLPVEDVSYDVVTGVSAGSLNTLAFSPYAPDDVINCSEFGYALWNSIPNYSAYGNWPGGILEGLFFKGGIFDLSPGVEWVTEQFGNKTVKRKVSFASVDANYADYYVADYNATYTQPADLIQSAFASSSIPGAFPPIQRGDMNLIDGGSVWNLDIDSAVRRCKEVVEDDSDIIVDIIMCGTHKLAKADVLQYHTLANMMRGYDIKNFYNGMSDFNSSMVNHPNVTWRYLIAPSESLSSGLLPLDFSQKQVDKCFEVGQRDAANAVKLGPGGYGKVLQEYAWRFRSGEDVDLEQMIEEALKKTQSGAHLESE